MTESEVLDSIRTHIAAADSIRALVREWGVTPSYLCGLQDGRRMPGPKILTHLGIRKVKTTMYVKVS